MAIPVYLWLEDDNGTSVKGSVDIAGREGSIEVLEHMHSVELPIDPRTGKITGKRLHSGYAFMKEIDSSTPYLYRSLSTGRMLKKATFRFYRINDNGMEEEYFRVTLENARVLEVEPLLLDVKNDKWAKHNHLEYIDMGYEKITWHYLDGNIIHTDTWKERSAI
ncbi:type VI secretion system tube protein Hcp [Cronobacter dublinensis]|uniref:Type VI secretion system tube protein Hcp n=1 Tax=Cronobacter dublinensis TaxID=413497 RepID=A0A9Q4XN39_9ENTR|nr:type VI secretion system tube protein TssD [Cronobacter dublinensis]NCH87387.1 type VI secretion system tube protein Hcp [Cronobacter dublinensis]